MNPTFIMMCGLVGSGKSDYAKELAKRNDYVICSSDSIREELFGDVNNQENNAEVFRILHNRIKENLKNGKNVIMDSTNISSKRRRAFLSELKNIPCKKFCIIMSTSFERCCYMNIARDRKVPYEVIKRMYMNWDTPYFFEGWDGIIPICTVFTDTEYQEPQEWIEAYIDYNQENSHHKMTLGEHCKAVGKILEGNPSLYYAGLLHDCGKPFTKSFVNSKGEIGQEAHYYQHECVGAYDSLRFEYPSDDIDQLYVSTLINYHMYPYFWEKDKEHGEKTREKYRKLWGEKMFKDVMKLHEADKMAH